MGLEAGTLCIDPGFNTGWAYFLKVGTIDPLVGEFKSAKSNRVRCIEDRLLDLRCSFLPVLRETKPNQVLIESAEGRGDLVGSVAAVRGDTIKLGYIIGSFWATCFQFRIPCDFILRRQWAGQLSDKALIKRIERVNGRTYREHERDAVGMGFSLQGVL